MAPRKSKIDRYELVCRHNPVRIASNRQSPMQVGNGRFAVGVDVTGLQTFIPFATLSDWGWKHDDFSSAIETSSPATMTSGESAFDAKTKGFKGFRGQRWDTNGRAVRYDMPTQEEKQLSQWLISNPNRVNLGKIGVCFFESGADEADVGDDFAMAVSEESIEDCIQTLDLWSGTINSHWCWKGQEVRVQTTAHPTRDALAVRIESALVQSREVGIRLEFPYGDGRNKFSAPYVGYWDPEFDSHHKTTVESEHSSEGIRCLRREMDDLMYWVHLYYSDGSNFKRCMRDHRYIIRPGGNTSVFEISVSFEHQASDKHNKDEYNETVLPQKIPRAAQKYWSSFWQTGAAIDFSRSSDARWREVERRLVLSQYVMRVNCAAVHPPQESGLVNLGWYGKFHMEMIWWHWAYLALFNRWSLLEQGLSVYGKYLDSARLRAREQGFCGARWPKMTDPSGRMAPGEINSLLIWQQPHPIAFAELDYRAHPTPETLLKWRDVVFATADFMASYAVPNKVTGRYDLGPPLHIVSENTDPRTTRNPAFELTYWRFGLSLAQQWRKRLGMEEEMVWSEVMQHLAPLPVAKEDDGVYVLFDGISKDEMWSRYNWEHPALAGIYGWLPGASGMDVLRMEATSRRLWQTWQFDRCWGWDFGVLAMNAARLGQPERAVEFLLDEQIHFDDVGLAAGGSQVPFPYLPANGSFLYAVAFMVAGWDGASRSSAGFPENGWDIVHEGLSRAF